MSIIPDSHADILDSMAMWHVATVGPGGEPQSSPVWIGWDGTHVMFSNLTTRQKYRNLMAEPQVALSATDPADPYRYLEVRGRVVRTDADPEGVFIDSMAEKYQGKDRFEGHRAPDSRCTIFIEPTHATTMGGAPD